MVKSGDISHHLRLCGFDIGSHLVNIFEEFWELGKNFEEGPDDNDTKSLPFTVSPKSFDHKFESNVLKDSIKEPILDDGSKKLCNLGKILWWIPVKESVLIKQSMEHTGVYLLLLRLW